MTPPFLMLFVALSVPSEATLWHDQQTVDGLRVDCRDVPGVPYEAVRVRAVSQQSLPSLCDAVLAEESDAPKGRFKKRELLRETATDRWVYEQVSVPILRDRDYVTHLWLVQPRSPIHCELAFQIEADPQRPPVPGLVRLAYGQGRWTLDQAGGVVSVSYEVVSDPGEHLAPSLVRGGQQDAAVQAVKAVLARAASR